MAFPLIPVTIAGLAAAAYVRGRAQKKGVFTPERKIVFETALATLRDPEKLKALADAFEKEDLKPQAVVLRKKAELRALPREKQLARRQAFRKAMSSKDAEKVEAMAVAFRNEGCSGAADALDRYASGLRGTFAGEGKDANG
jgi:hypothetical protein